MMSTKKDLQDRLDETEKQVQGLQNELGVATARAAELEEQMTKLEDRALINADLEIQLDLAEDQIESVAVEVDGLAKMLAFAHSTIVAVLHYEGPNPEVPTSFLEALYRELQEFADEFADGAYDFDRIVNELDAERNPDICVDLSEEAVARILGFLGVSDDKEPDEGTD